MERPLTIVMRVDDVREISQITSKHGERRHGVRVLLQRRQQGGEIDGHGVARLWVGGIPAIQNKCQ